MTGGEAITTIIYFLPLHTSPCRPSSPPVPIAIFPLPPLRFPPPSYTATPPRQRAGAAAAAAGGQPHVVAVATEQWEGGPHTAVAAGEQQEGGPVRWRPGVGGPWFNRRTAVAFFIFITREGIN